MRIEEIRTKGKLAPVEMRLGDLTSLQSSLCCVLQSFEVMLIPTMTHPKPLMFFNITPINPTGLTIVDLGRMDEDLAPNLDDSAVAQVTVARQNSEAARYTSLPPETRLQRHEHVRGGRHNSLPPKTVTIRHASPNQLEVLSADVSETGGDNDSVDSVEEASSMVEDSPTNVSCP
jgi:hypothetical protein